MTRIVGASGRFGVRYGKKIREAVAAVEKKQRIKQRCPFCKKYTCKRLSKGIWKCKSCKKKFTAQAYYLQ
ncbi:50S ribosomal protein L37ae [Candidatus Pacearchaeota archaeon CG06_land_8_20_14_3_00_35_12]|nr:MAG: 50S ribosomal protein L37ae [Candidatus Pacearchaeota archaeon CG06_land_8_20_14_3_00_35_12]